MSRPPPALVIAGKNLHTAATNVLDLLNLLGLGGASGDTVDDLRVAIEAYEKATNEVIAAVIAPTIKEPDYDALVMTHRALKIPTPLAEMLTNPTQVTALRCVARKLMRRQALSTSVNLSPLPARDMKRLAANDID